MIQFTIDVPEDRQSFFRELLTSLQVSFRQTTPALTEAEKEWVNQIREGIREAKRAERGEIELQDAREFLSEL